MIAFVHFVILAATKAGSRFQVSGWQSITTGIAPARTIAAAQEIMVNVGRMTSSPWPMRSAASASQWRRSPLQTATPCLQPSDEHAAGTGSRANRRLPLLYFLRNRNAEMLADQELRNCDLGVLLFELARTTRDQRQNEQARAESEFKAALNLDPKSRG